MKLCDILGVGVGVKTYSDPPTYFRGGGQDPNPSMIYASPELY